MYGHPEVDRYLVSARQSALLHEANEGRLAHSARAGLRRAIAGRSLRNRLMDLLRRTEPDFACVGPDCLPARS